jgi:hypothetical protein
MPFSPVRESYNTRNFVKDVAKSLGSPRCVVVWTVSLMHRTMWWIVHWRPATTCLLRYVMSHFPRWCKHILTFSYSTDSIVKADVPGDYLHATLK